MAIIPFVQIGGINSRELFNGAINLRHSRGQPLHVAGFIGQGGKDHLGTSDIALLDKYARVKEELSQHYPFGAEVSLIGADVHGVSNGAPDRGYLGMMSGEALARGFNWRQLSEMYADKGIGLPDRNQLKEDLALQRGYIFESWMGLPIETRETLVKQASKRSANGDAELDAVFYYAMRKQEEPIFDPDFSDSFFVVNGYQEQARHFFPQSVPQMYWVDVRDGGRKGRKQTLPPPWFRED